MVRRMRRVGASGSVGAWQVRESRYGARNAWGGVSWSGEEAEAGAEGRPGGTGRGCASEEGRLRAQGNCPTGNRRLFNDGRGGDGHAVGRIEDGGGMSGLVGMEESESIQCGRHLIERSSEVDKV